MSWLLISRAPRVCLYTRNVFIFSAVRVQTMLENSGQTGLDGSQRSKLQNSRDQKWHRRRAHWSPWWQRRQGNTGEPNREQMRRMKQRKKQRTGKIKPKINMSDRDADSTHKTKHRDSGNPITEAIIYCSIIKSLGPRPRDHGICSFFEYCTILP